jgi:hypothetical protein
MLQIQAKSQQTNAGQRHKGVDPARVRIEDLKQVAH